jgi:purine-binding chemotaxis protein CheW
MNNVSRAGGAQPPSEYIAFHVGEQTFCIDIIAVREIRGWTPATPLPQVPSYIRGVINLRGAVLPVVDLAARLGLPVTEPTPRHAIIVIQHGGAVVGLLVDAVSNILMLAPEAIQPAPEVGADPTRPFIKGIVAAEDEVISILIIKNLLPESSEAAAAA